MLSLAILNRNSNNHQQCQFLYIKKTKQDLLHKQIIRLNIQDQCIEGVGICHPNYIRIKRKQDKNNFE